MMAGLALAAVPLAGATAAAPATPDQRFVSELKSARQAEQLAFRQLTPWNISIDKVNRAKLELSSALEHLKNATQAATGAVGASDAEIAESVRTATNFVSLASKDLRKGNYEAVRDSVAVARDANAVALVRFGVPLAKEFQAFAVYSSFGTIQGFEEYFRLTAKVNAPISKVVIGISGRPTANVGEPGGKKAAPSLPITKLTLYTLQEPSGSFTSGWCKLVSGFVVCDLDPTMKADESFAVGIGPRVPKGTKYLVKLWSTDGRRSYSVLTTR